jgi:hypothetical protein
MFKRKKKKIEDIAWNLFQSGIKSNWMNLTRKEFFNYEDYDYWMNQAKLIYNFHNMKKDNPTEKNIINSEKTFQNNSSLVMKLKKDSPPKTIYSYHVPEEDGKYPIYDIPPSGKKNWIGGAFTLCFVYSKYNGNFVIRGYHREVIDFLKRNFTHYFCYISMWNDGQSRGHWKFWKENNVTIFEPSPRSRDKFIRSYKYNVVKYYPNSFERMTEIKFKRMPHRWIPEFDKL